MFQVTHILRLEGQEENRVQAFPVGRGKEDKLIYYNAFVEPGQPLYEQGVHLVSLVPETRLTPIMEVQQ